MKKTSKSSAKGRTRPVDTSDLRYVRLRLDVGFVVEDGKLSIEELDDRYLWRDHIAMCIGTLVRTISRARGAPVRVLIRPTLYHWQLLPVPKDLRRPAAPTHPNDPEDAPHAVGPTGVSMHNARRAPLPRKKK